MSSAEFYYRDLGTETPSLCGPGVSLEFSRASGLIHSLQLVRESGRLGDHATRVPEPFVSIRPDGAHDVAPADPSRVFNPVYQDLVKHELPRQHGDGLCVLLTGSWFQHHFSSVFSLYREQATPTSIILEVDLADRCRAPVEKLAATYSVDHRGAKPERIDTLPGMVAWRGGSLAEGRLELLAEPPAQLIGPELHPSTLVRVEARIDPHSFTQRLHYRWRWTSCANLTR